MAGRVDLSPMAMSTAAASMASVGIRTLVSAGTLTAATGMSSKPVMERSRGTRSPLRWARMQHADGDDVGGCHHGGRRLAEVHQHVEGEAAAAEAVVDLEAVLLVTGQVMALQ